MLLLKGRWIGGNLIFFGSSWLSTKNVRLTYSEAKRFLLWYVLYFSGLRRLNWTKNSPLESSLDFSDSLNYENIVEHSLIQAHKIHESVLYQAFFFLFFELVKKWRWSRVCFLGLIKPLQEIGEGKFIHMYFTSWQQVLSTWTKN